MAVQRRAALIAHTRRPFQSVSSWPGTSLVRHKAVRVGDIISHFRSYNVWDQWTDHGDSGSRSMLDVGSIILEDAKGPET